MMAVRSGRPCGSAELEADDEEPYAEEDEEVEDPPPSFGRPMLDADLHWFLADPLHASRKRYLPAGTYTIEVAAAGHTDRTTLRVKPAKAEATDHEASR
jgi:hypothetical protein